MDLLRLDVDLRDPLSERQAGVGVGNDALSVKVLGERVEHFGVFVHDGIDHFLGIEDVVDGEESEGFRSGRAARRSGWAWSLSGRSRVFGLVRFSLKVNDSERGDGRDVRPRSALVSSWWTA